MDSKMDLINNEREYYFRNKDNYNDIMNLLTEKYQTNKIKFVEVIKTVISPHSFQLVEYQDDIDYSTRNGNNKLNGELKKEIEIRQNYLNLKQKSSSKTEKMIRIFSPFFSSRFNIFENKSSLEEFIRYDGIYYLSLFFEYYYQILCKIKCIMEKEEEKNEIKNIKIILFEIQKNMIRLLKFFKDKLINKNYVKVFQYQINKFCYQMTVALKKYIEINCINDEIFNMIEELIEKILSFSKEDKSNDENLTSAILQLKSKFLGLLHDIFIHFYKDPKIK